MNHGVAEFEAHEREIRHRNIPSTALVAAAISVTGFILDLFVYPDFFWQIQVIRLVATVISFLIYFRASRLSVDDVSKYFASLLPLTIIVSICLMIQITDGGNSPYYAGLNLVLVALAILLRWTVKMGLKMSLYLIIAYVIAITASPEPAHPGILVNNFFFIGSNAILVIVGAYLYDLTRRSEFFLQKEIEDRNLELAENQLRLQELDEAKTRFFANVSHELRTPLTIMLGTTETLRDRKVTDLDARLEVLHANGLRLLCLIDNLLDLVRFDQGDDRVNREPVDAGQYILGIVTGVSHLADRKEISISCKADPPLPVLALDQDKLEKILLNLLINAVKFTSFGGKISVITSYQKNNLQIEVRDNGIGMSPDKQEQIFSRFWQADTSSNRKFRGSGIGLSLVKSLVDLMNGEVRVESVEGEGSTFFITIPAQETTLPTIKEEIPADPVAEMHRQAMMSLPELGPSSAIETTAQEGSSRDFKILVADDEEDLRRFLASELARDHEVIEASDGVEALALTRQYEPDLVLLDYMMPDKNGMEVCRAIRADHRLSHIPVIMLTARADETVKIECLRAGASDFVSKPFALGELSLRVKNQIGMLRFRRQLREQNVELGRAMEQLKENEVQMLRQEKLSALGRMSAGIIHEINNPLNYVQAAHHMMGRHGRELTGETADFFKDALTDAQEGVARVGQIITDLRSFTATGPQPMRPVTLMDPIGSAHKFCGDQLSDKIEVEIFVDPTITVQGDRGQLLQIFTNFFQNSIDAIEERQSKESTLQGKITIQAARALDPDGEEQIIATFRDNGCGIPTENRGQIFDPFYTGKEIGKGMGLGLSIVHQIIERHHAEVTIDSEEGQFTEFQLSFPSSLPST
ncbi:MAG: ATP-binding protein [Akkermansiaceae bacterium]